MGKIIALANQKVVLGKQQQALTFLRGLAYLGKKVLLVD